MSTYLDHPYYTHQPFLGEILKNTTGDVLECGCGEGSTTMIRNFIKGTNRSLVSIESNLEWLDRYRHLQDESHLLYHVPANNVDSIATGHVWTSFVSSQLSDRQFDVVFIDSSPWLSRKCLFDYFKPRANVVVIHDFDYYPNNGIIGKTTSVERYQNKEKITCDLSGEVKNYRLYYPPYKYFAASTGPPTLVCSDVLTDTEFSTLTTKIDAAIPTYYT
jgi:hypothetical protein